MSHLILKYVVLIIVFQISVGYGFTLQDNSAGKPKILGETSWHVWKNSAGWNDYSALKYQPNLKKINKLKTLIQEKDVNFIIFASSTCDECMHEVPIIFKIFELTELDSTKIKLIGVDENSQEPSGIYKNYDIKSTPTLIILSKNKVIGKVEPPDNEWIEFIIEYLENFQNEKK